MTKKLSIAFLLLAVLSIIIFAQKEDNQENFDITVGEVKEKIDSKEKIVLLDVRTNAEYAGPLGHLEGSILIPLFELEDRLTELDEHKNKVIIAICKVGGRSRMAANILIKNGFKSLNMSGGMIAYRAMEAESQEKESMVDSVESNQ